MGHREPIVRQQMCWCSSRGAAVDCSGGREHTTIAIFLIGNRSSDSNLMSTSPPFTVCTTLATLMKARLAESMTQMCCLNSYLGYRLLIMIIALMSQSHDGDNRGTNSRRA